MNRLFVVVGVLLVVGVAIAWSSGVHGVTPEQVFAAGKASMADGDFEKALRAFATAARADRENREYYQSYSMVRRILTLRAGLAQQTDPQRWEYMARALHAFYVRENLYAESLALGKQMHARLNTASSATMLAETQLAMNLNAEAAAVLAGLDPDKATAATHALHGLALVRQDKTAQARKIAKAAVLPKDAGPGTTYSVARLQAAIGNTDEALDLLARCFEGVAPSRLDGFKNHARLCPEFADLVSTDAFAKVLLTGSKVAESKCSGGSKCAGCPMRGSCPSGQK